MGRKRLLVFTNHFFPESFKINDIAFDFSKRGYDVTIVTGVPNYPKGKFFKGYGIFKRRREVIDGVKVIRLPLIPRGNGNTVRLMLNYLSYAISVCFFAFFHSFRKKYDIVFVHHTSPIFIGIGAAIVKRIQRIKLVFWNLDLWPESITATTNLKNKFVLKMLDNLVRWIYRQCDVMLIGSKGFEQSVVGKGVEKSKIHYMPNWAEDIFVSNTTPGKQPPVDLPVPDGFKVMFAGNIGEAQDFESIIEAAKQLRDYSIKWLLVGDGRKREWVEENIQKHHLRNRVFLLGRYPLEQMPSIFRYADAMLVSLKDEEIFKLTVPAKVQAYMASKKPIIAMLNGEGAAVVDDAHCGVTCAAEDFNALAKQVKYLSECAPDELAQLGLNGYLYYQQNFDKELCFNKLEKILEEHMKS